MRVARKRSASSGPVPPRVQAAWLHGYEFDPALWPAGSFPGERASLWERRRPGWGGKSGPHGSRGGRSLQNGGGTPGCPPKTRERPHLRSVRAGWCRHYEPGGRGYRSSPLSLITSASWPQSTRLARLPFMPDLAALPSQADRLLAAILTGKAGADAARELAEALETLERLGKHS